jgi:rhomboid protease GluP
MDLADLLVWIVTLSCLGYSLRGAWLDRENMGGWLWICPPVLVLTLAGHFSGRRHWLIAGEIAWGVLVVGPTLLSVVYMRCQTRQRFAAARRVAQVMRVLHPGDGWRELPEFMRALDLAHEGHGEEALAILQRHQNVRTANGLSATSMLYRVTHRWEEFNEWRKEHLPEPFLTRHPGFLPVVLRAFGETGDLNALLAWFHQFEGKIEQLPADLRGFCRLSVYAFCGRPARVERLFRGAIAALPADVQTFWLATAQLAAGRTEDAHRALEPLTAAPDRLLRTAVARRQARSLADPERTLSETSRAILAQVEAAHDQEERFGAQPGLWTRRARVTQGLIAANLILFGLEVANGGSTNPRSLLQLGALSYPLVRHGEWWRLGASLFLHLGWVHLTMNLLALWWLGPYVESVLGRRRYLAVYLLAGLASSGAALVKMAALEPDELLVGASGSIMGLVGATAAIAWRGWRGERARPASRRLLFVGIVMASEIVFDLFTPQVSLTAHLAGAAGGFLCASLLRHHVD